MANPRVVKAFAVTRALGLHDEEVRPVLKKLLQVYEKNWELIEEDNYRTLVDAFFELKEKEVNLLTHILFSLGVSCYFFQDIFFCLRIILHYLDFDSLFFLP